MATTRKTARRQVRNTKAGSNAMGIQKTINRDYALLARDYKKLFIELSRKPAFRLILGGVAITALVPVMLPYIRRIGVVDTFLADNVDNLDLTELRGKVTSTINNFRGSDVASSDVSGDMTDMQ